MMPPEAGHPAPSAAPETPRAPAANAAPPAAAGAPRPAAATPPAAAGAPRPAAAAGAQARPNAVRPNPAAQRPAVPGPAAPRGNPPLRVVPPPNKVSQQVTPATGFVAWLKRRWVLASFILAVLAPAAVTSLYLGLIASDRYAVTVKLAVRGQDTPAVDALGVLSSLGGGNTSPDSYIMVDYILSRNMIDDLAKTIDIRKIYSRSSIDWFSRLNSERPIEEVVNYWQKMVTPIYDTSTGIVSVEVSAYDPKETVDLANAVVAGTDALINRLNDESRRDALKAANYEVERAEQRQRMLRSAMRKFREQEQIADPVRRATFQQEQIERAKSDLQKIETDLQASRGFMKDTAPSIIVLKNQRDAAQKQLDDLQREIGGEAPRDGVAGKPSANFKAVASMLSTYEELEAERGFAEKAYLTALASLERARYDADRKSRYLAVFEKPDLPQQALYPMRWRDLGVTTMVLGLLWSLGIFIVSGIREHI